MTKPKVVIWVEGGLIQGIISDTPVSVAKIDYDIEGADELDLGFMIDKDGRGNPAYLALQDIEADPVFTTWLYGQVDEQIRAAEEERKKAVTLEIEREDEFGHRI